MNYTEYNFSISEPEPWRDILIAHLADEFESFVETEEGFLGYISTEKKREFIDLLLKNELFSAQKITYTSKKIENKNWNEEWEKDFQPIEIENKIHIRAEFHSPNPNMEYEIVIQPKMSFGTGHHSTTFLMLKLMYDLDFKNKTVLDMGCGTAILAIFAKMKGAAYTEGIDIDEWAFENAKENCTRNNVEIGIKKGEVSLLNKNFDVILANINKHILLSDIPLYKAHLNDSGILVVSGIMEKDFEDINEISIKNGLTFYKKEEKNQWISIIFKK